MKHDTRCQSANILMRDRFITVCLLVLTLLTIHFSFPLFSSKALIANEIEDTEETEKPEKTETEKSQTDNKTNKKEDPEKKETPKKESSKTLPTKKEAEMPSESIVFPNIGKPTPSLKEKEVPKTGKKFSTIVPDKEKEKKEILHPTNLEEEAKLKGRIPLKITRYAMTILKKYDSNQNGQIDHEEWSKMPVSPAEADINQDKVITLNEIAFRIANYGRSIRIRLRLVSENVVAIPPSEEEKADRLTDENSEEDDNKEPAPVKRRRDTKFYVSKSRLPSNLPAAFVNRDNDGDGQLTLREFAENPTKVQIRQFQKLDLNRDGLVTAKEFVLQTPKKKKSDPDKKPESDPASR
jgi:EF hand